MVKYLKCLTRKHQLEAISNAPSSTFLFIQPTQPETLYAQLASLKSNDKLVRLKSSPVGTAFGAVIR